MIEIENMTIKDFEMIKDNLQNDFDDFWTPSILISELKSEHSKYVVAKYNEKIVGFAGILILPDSTEITNIVTKKSERKKGIGNLLLHKIIELTGEMNKEEISLEVNEENIEAISLYKKNGFEQVGLRKKYYNGINDAIIMTKKINKNYNE